MDEMQDSLNYTNNFSKNEKKLVDEQNWLILLSICQVIDFEWIIWLR